jgi:putative transposase
MPRTARASVGGICYHVLNRGNARAPVFHHDGDYSAFVEALRQAGERIPMRILAYCLLPNHFHLALWPYEDGDLSRWMHWLLTAHVCRYRQYYQSSGHIWQGRFKAFPIQQDEHLLAVLRYIERNPVRAGLAGRAEEWRWSSAGVWSLERSDVKLDMGPCPRPTDWPAFVNQALTVAELERLRQSITHEIPYGAADWTVRTAAQLGLSAEIRPRGRPRGRKKIGMSRLSVT